jgi:hypothetical protein
MLSLPTLPLPRHVALAVPLLLALAILTGGTTLRAQTVVIRSVVAAGSGSSASAGHSVRGTVSQTGVGRLLHGGDARHDVGFWYKAYQPEVIARVSIPKLEAEIGTRITVPLRLTMGATRSPFLPRSFRARVRYNHTLMRPAGSTPGCSYDGGDCVLEITGQATQEGTIAELEFIVALGDAESTPITIESFDWQMQREDERITTVLEHGSLTLLGVCRVNGELRLIRSGAMVSRVRVWPNPISRSGSLEYVSAETGPIEIHLVDLLGNDIATLLSTDAEAQRLYQVDIDLSQVPSGSYHLVYITPSQRIAQRLLVTQ